jgi:hypothetical protein
LLNKLLTTLALAGAALAGPIEFGRAELDRAIAARRLNPRLFQIKTEVAIDPPESYRITPGVVTGGDLRGLMYGLLEAADQVRRTGRLQKTEAAPGMTIRGVRVVIQDFAGDLEWFHDRERWPLLFQTLALDRFNRFQLAVPDLAGLVSVPEFPQVAPIAGAERNLEALRFISDTAAEYGSDFVLGVWMPHSTDGVYIYAALVKVLASCPGIRGVQLRMDPDLAADAIRAVQEAGRRVTIEVQPYAQSVAGPAASAGLPIRYAAPYPAGTRPAKGAPFFFEVAAPATGSADELTRLVMKLAGAGASGFEADLAPAALAKAPDRAAAYLLLGRLAYDVAEPR